MNISWDEIDWEKATRMMADLQIYVHSTKYEQYTSQTRAHSYMVLNRLHYIEAGRTDLDH